jgi:hypothetical protein
MDLIPMLKQSHWHLDPINRCNLQMIKWYEFGLSPCSSISYLKQNSDLTPQLESLGTMIGNLSVMMEALCKAEGIDLSSIEDERDDQSTSASSSHTSDMSSEPGVDNEDNDGQL